MNKKSQSSIGKINHLSLKPVFIRCYREHEKKKRFSIQLAQTLGNNGRKCFHSPELASPVQFALSQVALGLIIVAAGALIYGCAPTLAGLFSVFAAQDSRHS